MSNHKFPYEWKIKDGYPAKGIKKNGLKVFSCFACGGGSTMGYKLAGYDVIGCNEIDPKMIECYIENHKPKYPFLEPIQTFKNRDVLPEELYHLDILDGSPPCSSFSMAGNRDKDWGKEKKFREGQADQVLDTLFFDFIALGKRLQPKVIIAENVKGLLMGSAREYLKGIGDAFRAAGYRFNYKLLNASKMGVPQRRERVFFYAIREDLACFVEFEDMFNQLPRLDLNFREDEIPFRFFHDGSDMEIKNNTEVSKYWDLVLPNESFSSKHPKGHFFGDYKTSPGIPLKTICAEPKHGGWHFNIKRLLNTKELIKGGTFPEDYSFNGLKPKYLIGMSVPPVMMAQIADRIKSNWFDKFKLN
jgi:DNA (cytosine-5)-methyltransferase 1